MRSIKHLLNHQISASMRICTEMSDADANVITTSRPEFGDYQANGVMRLAKQLKINPRELAKQVIEKLNSHTDNIVER